MGLPQELYHKPKPLWASGSQSHSANSRTDLFTEASLLLYKKRDTTSSYLEQFNSRIVDIVFCVHRDYYHTHQHCLLFPHYTALAALLDPSLPSNQWTLSNTAMLTPMGHMRLT